jgi:hypothetical protein
MDRSKNGFELDDEFSDKCYSFFISICDTYREQTELPSYIISQIIAAFKDIDDEMSNANGPQTLEEVIAIYKNETK